MAKQVSFLKLQIRFKLNLLDRIYYVSQVALKRQQALEEKSGHSDAAPPAFNHSWPLSDPPTQITNIGLTENETSQYDHFGLMKKLFPNQTDSVIL